MPSLTYVGMSAKGKKMNNAVEGLIGNQLTIIYHLFRISVSKTTRVFSKAPGIEVESSGVRIIPLAINSGQQNNFKKIMYTIFS